MLSHLSISPFRLISDCLNKIFILAILACSTPALAGEMKCGAEMHHPHKMNAELKRTTASYTIPKLTLIDQAGKKVSLASLLDTRKPVLVNFIFTSCTAICPIMSATFSTLQSKLGDEITRVRMISISIDPEHDTPHELSKYASRFHAKSQWSFLTGTLDQSIEAQKAFDAYAGEKMNHAPLTLFRRAPGSNWVRYEGFARVSDLVNDVHAALSD